MKLFSKSKKGEMTTQQIVVLIILIISFAIILFFLLKLGLGQKSEAEACHNSVVTRGNSMVPTDSYPLNCKRSYVCITEDGTCENMLDPIKEKVKTKDDVYKVLADEMANCWWIFGEGKINYVGTDNFEHLYCSICSQVAFDNSVSDKIFAGATEVDKKDFYKYLEKNNYSEGVSYLNYLIPSEERDKYIALFSVSSEILELNQTYYVLMGTVSDVGTLNWVLTGAGVLAAGTAAVIAFPAVGPAILSISGAATIGGWGAGGAIAGGTLIAPIVRGFAGIDMVPPILIKANSEEYKKLNCYEVVTTN